MPLEGEQLLAKIAALQGDELKRRDLESKAKSEMSPAEAEQVEELIIRGLAQKMRDMIEPAVLLAAIQGENFVCLARVRDDDFMQPRFTSKGFGRGDHRLDRMRAPYPELANHIQSLGLTPVLEGKSTGDPWGRDYNNWTEFGIRLPNRE